MVDIVAIEEFSVDPTIDDPVFNKYGEGRLCVVTTGSDGDRIVLNESFDSLVAKWSKYLTGINNIILN